MSVSDIFVDEVLSVEDIFIDGESDEDWHKALEDIIVRMDIWAACVWGHELDLKAHAMLLEPLTTEQIKRRFVELVKEHTDVELEWVNGRSKRTADSPEPKNLKCATVELAEEARLKAISRQGK